MEITTTGRAVVRLPADLGISLPGGDAAARDDGSLLAWAGTGAQSRARSGRDRWATSREAKRAATLRPHVVWFGELPLELDAIYEALTGCALFAAIGTSGQVYPAAGFVEAARAAGRAHTIELNLEPSACSSLFHEHRHGPAAELVPRFVAELLAHAGF